ncbi:MAG: hypothetical protein B7Z72_15335 [Gemmatimonadetes bacterium 21-71-4]|nr:MAG: hypothetical protein B7Z72_15335 [Gemmatimonadetes bacterium 21-71-4]
MKILPDRLKNGYLHLIDPVADWCVRHNVHPNTITVIGTVCTVAGGVIYGTGHISWGGFFLGLTATFDVLDGTVARRSGRSWPHAGRRGACRHHRDPHRHGLDHRLPARGVRLSRHDAHGRQVLHRERGAARAAVAPVRAASLAQRRITSCRVRHPTRAHRHVRPPASWACSRPASGRWRPRSWPASRASDAAIRNPSARSPRWRRSASASAPRTARR